MKLITVNRSTFTATLWRKSLLKRRFVVEKRYLVAIGRIGYTTPPGLYFVEWKVKDPAWLPPDSPWVGPDLRDADGKPVAVPAGDPRNPLAGAFISLRGPIKAEGVGFHGIPAAEDSSIGTAASHGCLRMHVGDVMDLFKRLPVNSPVFIYSELERMDRQQFLARY